MAPESAHTYSRRNIRLMAVWITPWMWCVGIAFANYHGESIGRAMAISAVQVVGGLAAWTCYHLIGRQNNGMMVFVFAFLPGQNAYRPDHPLLNEILLRVLQGGALVVIFSAFGVICRLIDVLKAARKAKKRAAKSSLWDSEIDLPPTRNLQP